MAQDTISLLTVLKNLAFDEGIDYENFTSLESFIDATYSLVFTEYPLFDESYRNVLNKKIVKHFIFEEINHTPYSRWKFMFNRKLNEIMPFFNQMYSLNTLEFNPLYDVDIQETFEKTKDSLTDTTSSRQEDTEAERQHQGNTSKNSSLQSTQNEELKSDSETESYKSDTPFNRNESSINASELSGEKINATGDNLFTGNQSESELKEDTQQIQNSESFVSSSDSKMETGSQEEYIKKVSGKRSSLSYGKIINDYRQSLINIDMMVIDALELQFRFTLN